MVAVDLAGKWDRRNLSTQMRKDIGGIISLRTDKKIEGLYLVQLHDTSIEIRLFREKRHFDLLLCHVGRLRNFYYSPNCSQINFAY